MVYYSSEAANGVYFLNYVFRLQKPIENVMWTVIEMEISHKDGLGRMEKSLFWGIAQPLSHIISIDLFTHFFKKKLFAFVLNIVDCGDRWPRSEWELRIFFWGYLLIT